jgi:small subunit ribosomal protein S18
MQQRRESGAPGAPAGERTSGERPQGDRPARSFGGRGRDFRSRRKVCAFCVDHIKEIDYKDVGRLRRYLSDRGKIEPRRKTGTCAKHQRRLSVALKNARFMALLPYTAAHIRGS